MQAQKKINTWLPVTRTIIVIYSLMGQVKDQQCLQTNTVTYI